MRGSIIASQIEADLRREKYYKEKLKKQKCSVDKEKKCKQCKCFCICENREVKDED